jgi:hypothetical protein
MEAANVGFTQRRRMSMFRQQGLRGVSVYLCAFVCLAATPHGHAAASHGGVFAPLECTAEQTGGFHDYPDDDQGYVPALFNGTPFRLEENAVFMLHLAEDSRVDLYLTLTAGDDPVTTELECRRVRGREGSSGYSCVNIPPAEMLLINAQTLRFTRTAVGGWTFAGASEVETGDSIFVEYGSCKPAAP